MANDRLYLVCPHCAYKDDTEVEDCMVLLYKYYPMTGKGLYGYTHTSEEITKFIEKHLKMHGFADNSIREANPFWVVTESSFSKLAQQKVGIMDVITDAIKKDKK